jgi:preprotein translocase subunit SecG
MYTIITILIVIVCILLGAVVLVQNPKGGGLSGSFGGVGQQLLGARHSTDIIEKLTWGFAVALLVLCLSTSFFVEKGVAAKKADVETSEIEKVEKTKGNGFNTPVPAQQTAPAAQPGAAQPAQPAGNPQ